MASVLALEPLINGVLGLASAVGLLAALLLIQEPSPSSVTLAPPVGSRSSLEWFTTQSRVPRYQLSHWLG
jgi:hypothetical protein